jgi:hypothetical protein
MKGTIYKISGYGLTYYGSTIQPLYERKSKHITSFRNKCSKNHCTSWLIFEKGDDWTIEPIEEVEFEDIDDLRIKESEYQKNNECVNLLKKKTKEELKQYKTEWAKKDRVNKGMKTHSEMTKTKDPNYKANWARNKRAKESDEDKAIRLARRRELYKLNH